MPGWAEGIFFSQVPVEHWHEALGDLALADAILDRLIHNVHKNKRKWCLTIPGTLETV